MSTIPVPDHRETAGLPRRHLDHRSHPLRRLVLRPPHDGEQGPGPLRLLRGPIVTGDSPLDSSVEATIDLASIDTNNQQRDDHIRSADFFDVEQHPTMTFRSTAVGASDDGFVLEGELSLTA